MPAPPAVGTEISVIRRVDPMTPEQLYRLDLAERLAIQAQERALVAFLQSGVGSTEEAPPCK